MRNKIIVGVIVLLVLLQFVPQKKNQETLNANQLKQDLKLSDVMYKNLTTSCFDCHSNYTNYPWYATIKPLSFWLDHHIKEGKEKLNFSEWTLLEEKDKRHQLHEIVEVIEENEMPLKSYTIIHRNAIFSEQQKLDIINWAKAQR